MNKSNTRTTAWSAGFVGANIVAFVLWNAVPTANRLKPVGTSPPSPLVKADLTAPSAPAITTEAVAITPVGTTDEAEFLLYTYGKLRSEIPGAVHPMAASKSHWTWLSSQRSHAIRSMSRDQMQKDLEELRSRVNRYHEYIKERAIEPKVQSLYSDLLAAIDITADYLVQLDRIDRAILDLRSRRSAETGYNTVIAGGYAAHAVRKTEQREETLHSRGLPPVWSDFFWRT